MVASPVLRYLLPQLQRCSTAQVSLKCSIFPRIAIPLGRNVPLHFSTSHKPINPQTLAMSTKAAKENMFVLKQDERLANGNASCAESVLSSSTIAAIVTALDGPPGAVGIIRLSGPSVVAIVGRVFRPMSRKRRKGSEWWPKSHAVEYGVVLDCHGNVIDEVVYRFLFIFLFLRILVVELSIYKEKDVLLLL